LENPHTRLAIPPVSNNRGIAGCRFWLQGGN
jgi:hypothetical protein